MGNVTRKCHLSSRAEGLARSASVQRQEIPMGILKTWCPQWRMGQRQTFDAHVPRMFPALRFTPQPGRPSQQLGAASRLPGLLWFQLHLFLFLCLVADYWLGEPPSLEAGSMGSRAALTLSLNVHHGARDRLSKTPHHLVRVGRKMPPLRAAWQNSWPDTWWMWELEELKCFVAMCWHMCIAVCIAKSKFHSLICQCHLLFKEIQIVLLPHVTLILRSFSWLIMM